MPRERTVDSKVIYETLKLFEIFDSNQKLKPRSDEVWKNACLKITPHMNHITLNAYVRENRYNLNVDLKQYFGIPVPCNASADSTLSSECQDEDYKAWNPPKKDPSLKCSEIFCPLTISKLLQSGIFLCILKQLGAKVEDCALSRFRVTNCP